jgi:hypothetical protein
MDQSGTGETIRGRFSRRLETGRKATGIFLILLGAALLLGELRLLSLEPLKRWWPVLLIAIGIVRLFGGSRGRFSGYWLLVGGVYGAVGEWNLFGMTWSDAWPIFVIAAGLAILIRPRFAEERVRARRT